MVVEVEMCVCVCVCVLASAELPKVYRVFSKLIGRTLFYIFLGR